MAKLADYVDIIENSMECVVLKVRDNSRTGLMPERGIVLLITVKREFPVCTQTCGRDYRKNGLFGFFRLRILHVMDTQSRSILTDAGSIGKRKGDL